MYFTDDQTRRLNDLTRQFEDDTGAEIVVTVVDKSDTYPEIPWKAFAMGASLASLALLAHAMIRYPGSDVLSIWVFLAALPGTGAICAFLSLFWPGLARLFLDPVRAEGETEQYAKSLFLDRELFNTPERNGLLVLISRFERQVVILPDNGIRARIAMHALDAAIDRMTKHLRRENGFKAIVEGLEILEGILAAAGFTGTPGVPDRIADELVQQKGGGQ